MSGNRGVATTCDGGWGGYQAAIQARKSRVSLPREICFFMGHQPRRQTFPDDERIHSRHVHRRRVTTKNQHRLELVRGIEAEGTGGLTTYGLN